MTAPEFIDRFRGAMRRTASGVTVLSTDGEAGRAGVTVSTFCSLSVEPPSVVVNVHRDSRTLPILLRNGVFAASVLSDEQRRVAEAFAGLIPELRDDRFSSGTWSVMRTGAPVLDGALAGFDCRVAHTFRFGSHCILVGEVIDVADNANLPLVYSDRSFGRVAAL